MQEVNCNHARNIDEVAGREMTKYLHLLIRTYDLKPALNDVGSKKLFLY